MAGSTGCWSCVCDAIYSFPSLLLAIVMAIAISGGQSSKWGGILAAAIAITVVYIPQYFRVIRAETVRIKAEPFVEAAKVIGAPTGRIMFRHVLRNATRTLPLIFTLNSSEALLTLAALGFLGFGIEPSAAAEWGYDLNKALSDVTSGIWWTALFPGLAIVLAVLGITLVGESLNDLADPRLRGRRAVESGAADLADDLGRARWQPGHLRCRDVPVTTPRPESRSCGDARCARRLPFDGSGRLWGAAVSEISMPGERVVDIRDLYVSFASDQGAVRAVDGVSLQVSQGEVLAVVGESGSGKTVTAKSILGLLPADRDHLGRRAARRPARRRRGQRCDLGVAAATAGDSAAVTWRWSSRSRRPR